LTLRPRTDLQFDIYCFVEVIIDKQLVVSQNVLLNEYDDDMMMVMTFDPFIERT